MQQFDLIIVGGGLAGASFALALRETRLRIALIENHVPHRPEGWDARIYAISPANVAFLESIGAWRHLDSQRIASIRNMEIYGDNSGRLDFSAFQAGVPELGCIVESAQMACEFWESAKRQSNLTLFCPVSPAEIEFRHDAAVVRLSDGSLISARLLVGADGRDSWVRESAGLASVDLPYAEKGVVANFSTDKPHQNTAFQWFLDSGVLAYLPLPGNKISIVWSTTHDHADHLCALDAASLCAEVAHAGGGRLGELKLITAPAAFPLRLIKVPSIVRHRLALIGDAAHGIHPLSGHGINLGFQDAKELAALISVTQPWQDIGDERLLKRYQRARREEIVLMQTTTDSLRRLFKTRLPGFGLLRNVGLDLTNRVPLIKNMMIRYALGAF